MTTCAPAVVELCRSCRAHVSWPVAGVTEIDQVYVYLNGSATAIPLVLAPDHKTVIGYFAGPAVPMPGVATVIHGVTVMTVEVVSLTEVLRFDGGMISLVA